LVDAGASRASYAALVVAEIQAHRYYPESARSHGEQGAVGVSFTIGPTGRVITANVVRSSGSADLDSAARQILRSISPPPPPGGSFSASTTIRFHVE
jgi:protein TonB